jgi:hypothetical protein
MTFARELNAGVEKEKPFRARTLSEAIGDLRKTHGQRTDAVGASQDQVRRIVAQVDVGAPRRRPPEP